MESSPNPAADARRPPLVPDILLRLTEDERRLLATWNRTGTAVPTRHGIHRLFEVQARRTPSVVALFEDGRERTYGELLARARQIAGYLRRTGISPEEVVGVYLWRSFDLVATLLGVLSAGGAYLPLDPNYPPARLAYMLEDSGVRTVVSQDGLMGRLPESAVSVVDVGRILAPVPPLDDDAAASRTQPSEDSDGGQRLAYVIYTSGSTGQPKGVLGTHGAAINRFNWMWRTYPFETDDVACQKTALSFVDSVWEIFGPLLQGIPSVLIRDEVVRDPVALIRTLAVHRVTRIVLVPSLLRALLDSPGHLAEQLPHLTWWVSSGEALAPELVERFRTQLPDRRLLNLYGSSEVAADATVYDTAAWTSGSSVPIGRPIDNMQVYVVDEAGRLAPINTEGELWIGGAGLARGYLRRPELTAEKFVPNPFVGLFAGAPEVTLAPWLYRTGDLARFLPDGNLEFRGRRDHQVKIRGIRIELGEIEAALAGHPAVRDLAVLAREDRPGELRLVAYFVPHSEPGPAPTELQRFLADRLPPSMVPTAFVSMSALPLLPNGKVDRRSLPSAQDRLRSGHPYRSPQNAVEHTLTRIWGDVLEIGAVGVDDNFFELGGHSLAAARVLARMSKELGTEVSLHDFLAHPTVAGLARVLATEPGEAGDPGPPLRRRNATDQPVLSYGQETIWFLDQFFPGVPLYHVPTALRVRGPLDEKALRRALDAIVVRHAALRTLIASVQGRPVAKLIPPQSIDLTYVDLSRWDAGSREAAANRRLASEIKRPFDLSQDLLLRAALIRLAPQDHFLLLTAHHVAFDGWSVGVLLRELGTLYRAFAAGEPSPLSELSIDFADYSHWQRACLDAERGSRLRQYWRDQLAREMSEPWLGADHSSVVARRIGDTPPYSDQWPMSLTAELTATLRRVSQQEGVTPFMVVLAVFGVLLRQLTGHTDMVIMTPVAGRTEVALEGLIGFFSNTLPLRLDLSGEPTWCELLQRARQVTLEALAHQQLPFYHIMQAARPVHGGPRVPWFTAMLNLENVPTRLPDLPGLAVSQVSVHPGVAQANLDLELVDGPDGLTGRLEYPVGLVSNETATRLAAQFNRHLTNLAIDVSQRPDFSPIEGWQADRRRSSDRAGDPTTPAVPEGVVQQLRRIWEDVLNQRSVGLQDDFFALGGHSLLALQVVARIEQAFGVRLSVAAFFAAPTIAALAAVVSGASSPPTESSLVPMRTAGRYPPFFAVHGFGGGVVDYARLARYLGPDQPFYGLQARGREGTASPHATVEDMAAHYVRQLRAVQPIGPYFLGGYSSGATIALEMAQQLLAEGAIVALLAALDGEAPGSSYRVFRWRRDLWPFLRNLPGWGARWVRRDSRSRPARLRLLAWRAWEALHLSWGRGVAFPPDLALEDLAGDLTDLPESVRHLMAVHLHALSTYWPRSYPGRVTLIRGRHDPLFCSFDPTKGWSEIAAGVDLHRIAAGHRDLLSEPYVRALAWELTGCLQTARRDLLTGHAPSAKRVAD